MGKDEEEADVAGIIPTAENNIVFFCAFEKEDQLGKRNMRNIKSNITPYRTYEELQMVFPFMANEKATHYISFSSYRKRYEKEEEYEAS